MTYLRQINRLRPMTTLGWLQTEMDRMREAAPKRRSDWSPPFTLHESDLAFDVRFALPGADPEQLDVGVEGDVLRVSGTRPGMPDDAQRRFTHERTTGKFTRALEFPVPVDAEHVQARYLNGVLHVTLPKAAGARSRRIEIRYEEDEE
jgi:HSP20 family protein